MKYFIKVSPYGNTRTMMYMSVLNIPVPFQTRYNKPCIGDDAKLFDTPEAAEKWIKENYDKDNVSYTVMYYDEKEELFMHVTYVYYDIKTKMIKTI